MGQYYALGLVLEQWARLGAWEGLGDWGLGSRRALLGTRLMPDLAGPGELVDSGLGRVGDHAGAGIQRVPAWVGPKNPVGAESAVWDS